MKKYEILYHFQVLNTLKEGKPVYILDREKLEVLETDTMAVGVLLEVLADAETNEKRYEFWTVLENEK